MGITTVPHQGTTFPRMRVMPVVVFSNNLVEKLPNVITTSGSTSRIWSDRKCLQASISSGLGSRLLGGRHLTTLAM